MYKIVEVPEYEKSGKKFPIMTETSSGRSAKPSKDRRLSI
jgi:hypothetical protein